MPAPALSLENMSCLGNSSLDFFSPSLFISLSLSLSISLSLFYLQYTCHWFTIIRLWYLSIYLQGIGYQKHCNEFTETKCRTVYDTSSEERCWTVYKKKVSDDGTYIRGYLSTHCSCGKENNTVYLNICLKQIKLPILTHTFSPISKLRSNISTKIIT